MGSTDLALSWKDHHGVLFTVFEKLLAKKALVDCTLAAEGKFLKAHRIVLSACSPYFEALLDQEYDKHPIIFLRDVQFEDLKTLLEFVYSGEIKIPEDRLVEFLNVAEALQIKGLGGAGSESPVKNSSSSSKSVPPKESDSPVPRKRSRHHSSSSEENSCDRAEIIPINTEQSRPIQSNETEVPKLSAPSIHSNKSNSVNEEIHVDVSKVKKEVINPPSSHSETQSDHEQEENEEILGLKPEFEQVTFTEDYSDDMLPEDNEDSELNQDQPSSSRQYPGFTTETVNPGEIAMHAPYAAGSAEPSVPEGTDLSLLKSTLPQRTPWHVVTNPDFEEEESAEPPESEDEAPCDLSSAKEPPPPPPPPPLASQPRASAPAVSSWATARRRRHRPSTKGHVCLTCHKQFMYPTQLTRHIRTHTGEKPFSCEVCQLTFTESGNLQKHMRVHTDERPFQCPYCLKTFRQKAHLQGHVITHTGERPYVCKDCGRSFSHTRNLRHHRHTHHPPVSA